MTGRSSSERALKLMAYADGELDGADLEEVEGWLGQDPDALRLANEVAQLGDLVKTGFSGSGDAKAIASFDIVGDVMAKVKAEAAKAAAPATPKDAAPVVPIDAARARKQVSYRVVVGAMAAMALAASVFVMVRSKGDEPLALAPVGQSEPVAAASSSGSAENSANSGPGVDIHVAETAEQSASVVYLPSENTLTTTVVLWVDETGDKK